MLTAEQRDWLLIPVKSIQLSGARSLRELFQPPRPHHLYETASLTAAHLQARGLAPEDVQELHRLFQARGIQPGKILDSKDLLYFWGRSNSHT